VTYLKWLTDRSGQRVNSVYAAHAFRTGATVPGCTPADVLRGLHWTFAPVAGLPTLEVAVDLLLAQDDVRKIAHSA
jgi:hypothetical protein